MVGNCKWLLVLLICTVYLKANPQSFRNKSIKFQHITADENYGLGNVWDIFEDHEGFIWFATEDGLYRYDGYELVAYKQQPGLNSISSNFALCIYEDKNENLWIGTLGGGLNLFDRKSNRFFHYQNNPDDPHSLPHDRVKSILEDHQGNLWFGTEGGGIAMLDTLYEDFSRISFINYNHGPDSPLRLSDDFIRAS